MQDKNTKNITLSTMTAFVKRLYHPWILSPVKFSEDAYYWTASLIKVYFTKDVKKDVFFKFQKILNF